jgi:hypothetical protein
MLVVPVMMMIGCSRGDIFMILEYDTNGTAMPLMAEVSFHTVELHVTLLGCDQGYYAETTKPLVCKECMCDDFTDGRVEAFVPLEGI